MQQDQRRQRELLVSGITSHLLRHLLPIDLVQSLHQATSVADRSMDGINDEGSGASSRRTSPILGLGSPPSNRGSRSGGDDNLNLGHGHSAFQRVSNNLNPSPRRAMLPQIYESHFPTEDPKRGDMYAKYLGGTNGIDSVDEINLNLLEELALVTPEMQKVILWVIL